MAGLRFTAEEWAAALEPPTFAVGARTYTGRVLSIEEWAPFADASMRAGRGELSDAETAVLVRRMVGAMFPPDPTPPPRRCLLGWRRRTPDSVTPADVFCALPWPVQLVYLQSFSRCQAQLLTPPTTKAKPATTRSAGPPTPGSSDNGGSASAGARPKSGPMTTAPSSSAS